MLPARTKADRPLERRSQSRGLRSEAWGKSTLTYKPFGALFGDLEC